MKTIIINNLKTFVVQCFVLTFFISPILFLVNNTWGGESVAEISSVLIVIWTFLVTIFMNLKFRYVLSKDSYIRLTINIFVLISLIISVLSVFVVIYLVYYGKFFALIDVTSVMCTLWMIYRIRTLTSIDEVK